jgi:SnoaL-like domain
MPAMWRYSTRDPVSSSAGMIHFDCPRCGLTITPKASSVTVEHCPRCVSASGARTAPAPDAIVTRWVDAFNVWDLEGMLARFHPEVLFHPLRVAGLDRSYRGHDGVRRWFVRRTQCAMSMSSSCPTSAARAMTRYSRSARALALAGEFEITPFCALHRIIDGLIVAAHHCLTDPDMLERLGLVP